MKNAIYLCCIAILSVIQFSCGKSSKPACEENNTGSIMIHNDGVCTFSGTTDFFIGTTKIASLAVGQMATVDNLPVGEITLIWKESGGPTYFTDKDTIVQCAISHYSTERLSCASDKRLKKNIMPVNDALESLGKLNIYTYEYNAPKNYTAFLPKGIHYGFMAQELKEIYPSFVHLNNDGYYSVNYQEMIPLLAKGIQEQQTQIEELKKEVAELKSLVKQQTFASK